MNIFLFNFFLIFFFFSCETTKKDDSEVLARVSGKTLTIKKAQKLNEGKSLNKETIPRIVSDWVTKTVLLDKGIEMNLHKDSLLLRKRDSFFNSLIISAFLDQTHYPKINISNKEVLNYYNENKESFSRDTDEVFLEHYFTEKPAFSNILMKE